MEAKKDERVWICFDNKDDVVFSEQLLEEFEAKDQIIVSFTPGYCSEIPGYAHNAQEYIRTVIRRIMLKLANGKHVSSWIGDQNTLHGYDHNSEEYYVGNLAPKGQIPNQCPDFEVVQKMMLPPVHHSYSWQNVAYWKIVNFEHILHDHSGPHGSILIPGSDIFLFADEVEKIKKGENVPILYYGGVFMFLVNELENVICFENTLYKIRAFLSD